MITASTHIIDCWADFERLQKYTSEVKSDNFILDVETDSEIEKKAKLYGIGVCFNNKRAFYIVIRRLGGEKVWTETQEKAIASYLEKTAQEKKLINHNILYDVLVLENNLSVDLSEYIYADTMMMKHTLNEEPPHGLKENAQIELGDWAVDAQDDMKASVLANGGKWNKTNKDMYKADTDLLAKYCMWDALLTLELYKIYSKRLKEENLEEFFYEEEVMPLYTHCTIPMKRNGFPVDEKHFKTLKKELEEKILALEDEVVTEVREDIKPFIENLLNKELPIKSSGNFPKILADHLNIPLPVKQSKDKETGEVKESITLSAKAVEKQLSVAPEHSNFYNWVLGKEELNISDDVLFEVREKAYVDKKNRDAEKKDKHIRYAFNLNSSDHLAYYFFTLKGYEAKEKTEKGKNKLNASFIDDLKANDEIAQKIIDYKKLQKLLSTYVVGFLKRIIDGRIYTSMLQHGTTSGRYSSTNPNCQNLPRIKDEEAGLSPLVMHYVNLIKQGLVAPKNGKIVNADFSQLEPCCFATASGDPKLQAVFHKKEDLYSRVAIDVFKMTHLSADKKAPNFLKKVSPEFRNKAKVFCFVKDTKIETPEGIKNIQDLKIGDLVKTKEGFKKILNTFEREANTYNFITNRGGFVCTADHKVWNESKQNFVEAKNFHKNDIIEVSPFCSNKESYVEFPIYSSASFKNGFNKPYCTMSFDENWAYILGAFLGDGVGSYQRKERREKSGYNSHLISSYVGICGLSEDGVTDKWRMLVEQFGWKVTHKVSTVGRNKPLALHINADYEFTKLFQLTFKSFETNLDNSLHGHKNLKVQDFVFNSPLSVKLSFIAGLLDTDGYLKYNKKSGHSEVSLCSKSFELIADMQTLMSMMGVATAISLDYNKTYKRNYYILRFLRAGVDKLRELGLQNYLVCERKKQAISEEWTRKRVNRKNHEHKFIMLEATNKVQKVYDITVQDVHEFYANGIRVHNCLAVPYGAEASRIAQAMNTDYKEGNKTINAYLTAYPDLKKYMMRCNALAKKEGKVTSAFGRVRHLPRAKELYERYGNDLLDWKWAKSRNLLQERREFKTLLNNAKNFPIQSMAASIVNRSMIAMAKKIKEEGLDAYVALQIHDEITVIANKAKDAERLKTLLRDCMENTCKIAVPLVAEPIIADNMAEAK